ncbi:chromate efflux transporter [Novosphingobium sp. MW5]|nr:chromate efflux transporter [Novosphingobium sp. MW5]
MTDTKPEFNELVRTFARIGCLSFGGPAGQIALMHREVVEERGWVDEGAYLRALNLCHLLPGPEAQQLATWIGWKLHGVRGGLAAGLLFIVPGALVMLLLSMFYVALSGQGWFEPLFLGIKAAVLAIVAQAVARIAGRALGTQFKVGLAIASFLALAALSVPFPLVVFGAALIGAVAGVYRPDLLQAHGHDGGEAVRPTRDLLRETGITLVTWAGIWALPMVLIALTLGTDSTLWDIGAFFSKLAVATFGGAYAVLSWMAQASVEQYGWLTPGEMADGLGLAETTPGPLILVTQHVGFLAGLRDPGPLNPLVGGFLGALVTTWVTFAPCFLWIFAFAPWTAAIERVAALQAALAAITAAVVGVIANLAVWFALHVLFSNSDLLQFDWRAALIAALAALLLFRMKRSVLEVLAVSAVAGLILGHI